MKVLIVTSSTADDRKTLAAVRALGRAGVTVHVGGDDTSSAPFRSRYCRRILRFANPAIDLGAFVDDVVLHLSTTPYDVLLPLCDYTTTAVVVHEATVGACVGLAVPPLSALDEARDKWRLMQLAARLGLPTPKTHLPANSEDIDALSRHVGYPCVVKLRRGAAAVGFRVIATPAELVTVLNESGQGASDRVYDFGRPIVQEYVPGELHDVCLLFNRGEPRASLTQRRLLMHPEAGGVGVINETTEEPELRDQAITLLRALKWHGPAQVEFKLDPRDGEAKLIEVNGRFWGTLDLSIRAGVNFPLLTFRLAVDGDVEPVEAYRVGLKYRWPMPFAVRCMRRSARPWRTVWQLCRPELAVVSDFAWTDPIPNLVNMLHLWKPVRYTTRDTA